MGAQSLAAEAASGAGLGPPPWAASGVSRGLLVELWTQLDGCVGFV